MIYITYYMCECVCVRDCVCAYVYVGYYPLISSLSIFPLLLCMCVCVCACVHPPSPSYFQLCQAIDKAETSLSEKVKQQKTSMSDLQRQVQRIETRLGGTCRPLPLGLNNKPSHFNLAVLYHTILYYTILSCLFSVIRLYCTLTYVVIL